MTEEKQKINVLTWNVLSQQLCSKRQFPTASDEAVNKKIRLKKTKEKLNTFIKNRTNVFLLQEVTREWGNVFTTLFKKKDFTVLRDHYGFKYNGNMGIMIAFKNCFQFEDIISEVIGHKLYVPIPEYNEWSPYLKYKTNDWLKWFNKKYSNSMNYMGLTNVSQFGSSWFNSLDVKSDERDAVSRQNVFLAIKLSYNGKSFYVANYHMPCAFKRPRVMMWHAMKCNSLIRKLKDPIIFGGDFNSQPDSPVYQLFNEEEFKSVNCDNESDTINTLTSWNGEFKGCIDYIFYKKGKNEYLKLLSVDEPETTEERMPNDTQTSDHRPIIARFNICD